jgi:CHAT domain-containing protein
LGVTHPDTAMSLNNLALLYRVQGKYGEAELLHARALKIREEKLGTEHPDTAMSLNNLAKVYQEQQKYQEAEKLYLRGLNIYEHLLGSNHPSLAKTLDNLAQVYVAQQKLESAELFYLRAIFIIQEVLGENHPDLIMSMHNLGSLYSSQKKYDLAEKLFIRALKIESQQSWKSNGHHIILNNLALLYKEQEKYPEAEALYERSLKYARENLDKNNPEINIILENLAAIYIETERPSSALPLFIESVDIITNHLKDLFFYSDDATRVKQTRLKQSRLDLLLSYVLTYLPQDSNAVQAVATAVIKWKALATEATATLQNLLYTDRYPHLKSKFLQLQYTRDRITNLLVNTAVNQNTRKLVDELEQKRQLLEKELSSEVPEIRLINPDIDYLTIANSLPSESILIEFFQFDRYDLKTVEYLETIYIALIISNHNSAEVKLVNLGKAIPIDDSIQTLRNYINSRSNELSNLGIGSNISKVKKIKDRQLFSQLLAPIINIIPPCTKLIIVPSGSLYLLPFEILPLADNNELLIDRYQINYLNSSRDLLRQNVKIDRPSTSPVIITDPDYNFGNDRANLANIVPLQLSGSLSNFERHPVTVTLGEKIYHKFNDATIYQGAQAIEPIVKNLTSPSNLVIITHGFAFQKSNHEELFRTLVLAYPQFPTEDIIHHYQDRINLDFYKYCRKKFKELSPERTDAIEWSNRLLAKLDELIKTNSNSSRLPPVGSPTDRSVKSPENTDSSTIRSFKRLLKLENIDNPMLRSGLALAGANLWLKGESLPPHLGKGVILAEDIAQMDLWNTQLVVLIACSTGLGEINVREGVVGLRRAFALAGAKTLIMSLWDVPAQVTMVLMDKFFELYSPDVEISIALQQSQKYIRDITIEDLEKLEIGRDIIAELSDSGNSHIQPSIVKSDRPLKHPYYWGGWICQGG